MSDDAVPPSPLPGLSLVALLICGMNFLLRAALSAALNKKFIPELSNAVPGRSETFLNSAEPEVLEVLIVANRFELLLIHLLCYLRGESDFSLSYSVSPP